jgi:alpha-L-rhamnosidase
VRGTIVSKWTRNGSDFTLNASIPPGATATVILPTLDAASITESGIPIEKAPGVTAVHQTSGNVSVDIGSGSYLFRASLSHPASTDAAGKTP